MRGVVAESRASRSDTDRPIGALQGGARLTQPAQKTKEARSVFESGAASAIQAKRLSLRPRHGRERDGWNADEIAEHLMSRRAPITRGLARRTPWVGLDEETIDSCYSHAAAIVVNVAVGGQRVEWRTPKDLERAQIAAFRHQALDHWKRANAQSRRGDRFVVAFDPEMHSPGETPIDRLFEQQDLITAQRDVLADLSDEGLRTFWTSVVCDHQTFKQAGERLGWTKREVIAATRVGRAAFTTYLERRDTGELCRTRGLDVLAARAGVEDAACSERAEAHLECCYACALVYEPSTSALQRGILSVAPVGFLLRLLLRAGDVASAPMARVVDSGSASRAVAAGVAALAVGAGVGAAARKADPPKHSLRRPSLTARFLQPVTHESAMRAVTQAAMRAGSVEPSSQGPDVLIRSGAAHRRRVPRAQPVRARQAVVGPSAPAQREFDVENRLPPESPQALRPDEPEEFQTP